MIVVLPVRPGGACDRGILVWPGITKNGDPFIVVVEKIPPGFRVGFAGAAIVVAPGTTKTGTPFIVDVMPLNPGGASDRGMVV
jgi:hypothetical protein